MRRLQTLQAYVYKLSPVVSAIMSHSLYTIVRPIYLILCLQLCSFPRNLTHTYTIHKREHILIILECDVSAKHVALIRDLCELLRCIACLSNMQALRRCSTNNCSVYAVLY